MESNLIAMIVVAALVLATATVYTQSAFATMPIEPLHRTPFGIGGGNGVTGGQAPPGPYCDGPPSVAAHNPNCGGQTPTGGNAANGGNTAGSATGG